MLYRMFSIYCTYTFYQIRGISQSFSGNRNLGKLIGVSEMSQIYLRETSIYTLLSTSMIILLQYLNPSKKS